MVSRHTPFLIAGASLAILIYSPGFLVPPNPVYLWVAQELRAGRTGPHLYDEAVARSATLAMTEGRFGEILPPTPPSIALFTLPWTLIPASALALVWTLGNGIAVAIACVLILTVVASGPGPCSIWGLLASGAALLAAGLSPAMFDNLIRGQVFAWLLASLALACWGAATTRQWAVGLGLASAMLLKLAAWPAWIALAVQRQWSALRWAGMLTFIVLLASLPWIGPDTWTFYMLSILPAWLVEPRSAVPAYQTLPGIWRHMLAYHPIWNPAPLLDVPWLAGFLTVTSSAVVLMSVLTLAAVEEEPLAMIGCAIVASIICSPVAEQHHYLLAVIPLAGVAGRWPELNGWLRAGTVLSAALMYLPLPFKDPSYWAGWWGLLAYPRLYGGLTLLGVLVIRRFSTARKSVAATS